MKVIYTVWFMMVMIALLAGCRFAPTESQKDIAYLTHQTAQEAVQTGLTPESPKAKLLEQGTLATTVYYGTPESLPPPESFTSENIAKASNDASRRPSAIDAGITLIDIILGTGILGVSGTVIGARVLSGLRKGRAVAIALEQVVKGNKAFIESADEAQVELLKTIQDGKQDTATKQLVAQIKHS